MQDSGNSFIPKFIDRILKELHEKLSENAGVHINYGTGFAALFILLWNQTIEINLQNNQGK